MSLAPWLWNLLSALDTMWPLKSDMKNLPKMGLMWSSCRDKHTNPWFSPLNLFCSSVPASHNCVSERHAQYQKQYLGYTSKSTAYWPIRPIHSGKMAFLMAIHKRFCRAWCVEVKSVQRPTNRYCLILSRLTFHVSGLGLAALKPRGSNLLLARCL